MKLFTRLSQFLLSVSLISSLEGGNCANPYCNKQEDPTRMDINFYLQTLQDKGIGYPTGYSTAAAQLFPGRDPEVQKLYFIDARAHYFNDNRWAANLGFGARGYSRCLDKVVGVNLFYDFRQIHDEYHQVGLGLEFLGRCFDVRANGYLPVATTTMFGNRHHYDYPDGFFASCQGVNRALWGADAELSTSLANWSCFCRFPCGIDPYVGIGPYYYNNRNNNNGFCGGKARVGANIGKRTTVEVRGSYDNVYGTIVQGFISFNFSLGPEPIPRTPSCCYDPYIDSLLTSPIQRNEIIVESKRCCRWSKNF